MGGRNLLIVEGEFTRLGLGNDLFDNANHIKRILCPAKNAFSKYDEIIATVRRIAEKDDLILLALGPTATVMAAELSNDYQAIDIGHIDIEYEWYKMGAKEKIPVKSKYVNEARNQGGTNVAEIEDDTQRQKYEAQIVKKI